MKNATDTDNESRKNARPADAMTRRRFMAGTGILCAGIGVMGLSSCGRKGAVINRNAAGDDADFIIIGSGHNSLACAMMLSRAGHKVLILEGADTIGGAAKTREITLPGFRHDLYSTNIGLFMGSPLFGEFRDELQAHGFRPVVSDCPVSSLFPDETGIGIYRDAGKTHERLSRFSRKDADAWTSFQAYFNRCAPLFLPLFHLPMPSFSALRQVWRITRNLGMKQTWELAQLLLKSPREYGEYLFEHPKSRALLASWAMHLDFGPEVSGGATWPGGGPACHFRLSPGKRPPGPLLTGRGPHPFHLQGDGGGNPPSPPLQEIGPIPVQGIIPVCGEGTIFLQQVPIYGKYPLMKKNRWEDHYTRRARREKWLARSVYKLEEMDRKFNLIRKGGRLLDLGCYPGSWSQYGIRKVGPGGAVTGIDLTPPDAIHFPNFRFIKGDVLAMDPAWLRRQVGARDVVMSDLAPQTTGDRWADTIRSIRLAERAAEIARAVLGRGGRFVCKVFEGEDLATFRADLAGHFRRVRLFRPGAVRKGSREIYLVALDRVQAPGGREKTQPPGPPADKNDT